jgi:hypothetical protein
MGERLQVEAQAWRAAGWHVQSVNLGREKRSGVSHDDDASATRPPLTVRFRHVA